MPCIRLAPLAAVAVLACSPSEPAPQARSTAKTAMAPEEQAAGHVVVLVELGGAGPRVLQRRRIDTPLQLDRAPGRDGWAVEIDGEHGEVLYRAPLRPVGVIRGEFPGIDGQLEHHQLENPRPVVTLRLPVLPGAARVRLLGQEPLVETDGAGKRIERTELTSLAWSEVAP